MAFLDALNATESYLGQASSILDNGTQTTWTTQASLSSNNGLDNHDTKVSKFLRGGRLDNLLHGHNKIVNGMEDPSFFAFTFGITASNTGLFGNPNIMTNAYDLNSDRNYSVLTYLQNAISPNTIAMMDQQKNIEKGQNQYIDLNKLYKRDEEGNIVATDTDNDNIKMTFVNEFNDMYNFVNGFQDITINHPYMLQSVDGLQDAYKKYYNIHKDSFLGGNDTKIKIKCLESMDLRMSALFDSYFKAVYNHRYRRMNIPINLLRFDCWLLVHDLRNIAIDKDKLDSSIYSRTSPVTKNIVDNLSTILFEFKNCYFDIEEIGSMLGTINNTEANQTSFEFTFNYTDIDVYVNALADLLENSVESKASNKYETLDIHALNVEPKHETTNEIGNMFEDTLNLSGLVGAIGSTIFNYATNGKYAVENVYDKSWAGILSSMYSSISTAGVSGILNNAIWQNPNMTQHEPLHYENIYNNSSQTHEQLVADNIYEGDSSNHEQMQSNNIYEGEGSTHEQLNPDNIYSNIPSNHEQLVNESIEMNASTHGPLIPEDIEMNAQQPNQLLPELIDMSTNGIHTTLLSTNIYPNISISTQYIPENIDMSTSAVHGQIDSTNVYTENSEHKTEMYFGNVYSFTTTSTKMIPVNVYERIIKSRTNKDITIEKIFIPPTKAPSIEIEKKEELLKETKASTLEEMNAFSNEAKQKILNQIRSIGNVYSD